MAENIDRLSIEIVSDASKASDAVERLTTQLIQLKNALRGIDTSGLKKLSGAMNGARASSKNLTEEQKRQALQAKRLQSAYNSLVGTTKKIASQQVSLRSSLLKVAGIFGTIYASCFMLVRAFGVLKKAIDYAADLTEIQNVVDVTFGNASKMVDEFTQTSIKDFGMNELSVKQFASRYQAMGVAMGITNEQVKNAHEYLSQFRTPTGAVNGYNELSSSMADMSINLTKLTGDLASFYNQNQEDVAQALQSGIFAGQTRPLMLAA